MYFCPPLYKVGLLQWSRFDQILRQGYEHGLEVLGKLDDRARAALPRIEALLRQPLDEGARRVDALAQLRATAAVTSVPSGSAPPTTAAAVPSDYKALICIFLNGGNDANNLIIPTGAAYTTYASQRGVLALPSSNLLSLSPGEEIASILPVREFTEGKFVMTVTERGVIKKTDLMEYSRPRAGGIIAMGLNEKDRLIATAITTGQDEVSLSTRQGMSIRFHEEDVRPMGRAAVGVRGIDLGEGDDSYASLRMSQGWGHLGVGVLYDDGGIDVYQGEADVLVTDRPALAVATRSAAGR